MVVSTTTLVLDDELRICYIICEILYKLSVVLVVSLGQGQYVICKFPISAVISIHLYMFANFMLRSSKCVQYEEWGDMRVVDFLLLNKIWDFVFY